MTAQVVPGGAWLRTSLRTPHAPIMTGPVACTFCRKRKIKCNRGIPCDSCVRHLNPSCQYPGEPSPVSTERLLVQKLIKRIEGLEKIASTQALEGPFIFEKSISVEGDEEDDEMNVFDHYEAMDGDQFVGPLSFIALIKMDPELKFTWQELSLDPDVKQLYASVYPKSLRLSFSTFPLGVSNDRLLLDDIIKALPSYGEILVLLDYFFKRLYPYFPVLDELDFRYLLSSVFGEDGTRIPTSHKKKEFMFYGQLLVVLRLSYSCNQNLPLVSDTAIDLANECLNKFDLFETYDLSHFQLMLLLRSYQFHAPEYGESLDQTSSGVFTTLLVEKGYHLGLHRDPSILNNYKDNEREDNLRRKCWNNLRAVDSLLSLMSGNPTNFTKFAVDTRPKYSNAVNHNCLDDVSEELSTTLLSGGAFRSQMIQGYVTTLNNLDQGFKMNAVKRVLEDTYDAIAVESEVFKQLMQSDNEQKLYYVKSFKLKFFFYTLCTVITLRYYMFQFYMKKSNIQEAMAVLTGCFSVMYTQVLPILIDVISEISHGDKQPYEESFCKFVLYPSVRGILHKMITVTLSVYTKAAPELRQLLKNAIDLLLKNLLLLGTTCFYSWKMLKLNRKIYHYIDTHRFFNSKIESPEIASIVSEALSAAEFNDMLKGMELQVDDSIWFHVVAMNKIDTNFPFTSV